VRNVGIYIDTPTGEGVRAFDTRSGIYLDESIGNPLLDGATTLNDDDTYHMTCGGADIWGWKDEGHFKSRPETGDIEVVVRVDEIAPITDGWAKAGVMLRSNYDDDAVTVFGLLSGTNGVAMHTRVSKGNYMTMPGGNYDLNQKNSWLKLTKIGSLMSFYYSDDGVTWTKRAEENVFFPEDEFRVGLACTSHQASKLTEATFSNYEVTRYAAPTGSPTMSSAPTAWDADKDIGEPLRNGEYWADVGSGVTKLRGGGSGIWGSNDSFFFHSNQRENDAFTMTAYVHGFGSGEAFAKGGIMIRTDDSSDASNVFIGAMGGYKGIGFQSRQSAGAATVHHGTHWVSSNKAWIKLIKTGDVIEALYRTDSEEEWNSLGTKSLDFAGSRTLQVGYAVTVGNEDNSWNYADLYMKNFSVE
jgi:regulation of enolase protein 1 (concanavalin A-like superfamily)